MNSLLSWVIDTLNASPISSFVMDNAVVFPALEMAHFLGLCLLFGALLVVDLRMVGFAKAVPIKQVDVFLRWALIGFAINVVSGLLFVVGDADRYLVNIAFWAKMGCIILAGLNTLYFVIRVKPQMATMPMSARALNTPAQLDKNAQVVAWISLFLWTSVIILGRFIPYVETP
ncbi:hypothetical protein J5X92_20180 [Alteromonas sp. K632G]|uniref:DUF6644 family protein n=1 Tax=Alteromonas sp. K632G TaxID=2820757 RepID=UPI001AD7C525|nr:DUF6644 family protein [Alteromonas sp. K632G]MBO7924521.1 hypothetical protein [Alteromonas sp. K632G]|tara:strand:- start:4079 stop:4597 length:519 start_codon:yes stop_codon:yes gene_type:complete